MHWGLGVEGGEGDVRRPRKNKTKTSSEHLPVSLPFHPLLSHSICLCPSIAADCFSEPTRFDSVFFYVLHLDLVCVCVCVCLCLSFSLCECACVRLSCVIFGAVKQGRHVVFSFAFSIREILRSVLYVCRHVMVGCARAQRSSVFS